MVIIKKLVTIFSVILYAIATPYLEINDKHIWNRDLTPYARIHEVWQLISNSSIRVLYL
jgi:hypothetical protein